MSETIKSIKSEQHFYSALSFWGLIVSNLVVIVWALIEHWPLGLMVWVYFSQNVILGFFWPAKVFESPTDASYAKKVRSVAVFLPHYLLVHCGYALSLYTFFGKELSTGFKYILIMAGIFFLSEIVSYCSEDSFNRTKPLSLAKVQLFPYARIVPMHFVMCVGIILEARGTTSNFSVIFFLLLKALADVAMYMVEQSSVFGNLVTYWFERHKESGMFGDYSNLKEKQEACQFCQRVIGRNETAWVIKENVVCQDCYNKIEKAKRETS